MLRAGSFRSRAKKFRKTGWRSAWPTPFWVVSSSVLRLGICCPNVLMPLKEWTRQPLTCYAGPGWLHAYEWTRQPLTCYAGPGWLHAYLLRWKGSLWYWSHTLWPFQGGSNKWKRTCAKPYHQWAWCCDLVGSSRCTQFADTLGDSMLFLSFSIALHQVRLSPCHWYVLMRLCNWRMPRYCSPACRVNWCVAQLCIRLFKNKSCCSFFGRVYRRKLAKDNAFLPDERWSPCVFVQSLLHTHQWRYPLHSTVSGFRSKISRLRWWERR